MFKDVGGYVIRACRLARIELRKRLLRLSGGEGLFDLLPRGGLCGLCRALDIHDCIPGVLITHATADLRILWNER